MTGWASFPFLALKVRHPCDPRGPGGGSLSECEASCMGSGRWKSLTFEKESFASDVGDGVKIAITSIREGLGGAGKEKRGEWRGGAGFRSFYLILTTSYKAGTLTCPSRKEDPEVRGSIQGLLPGEDSPVRGQGRGRGRRSQGLPCGLVIWGLGCSPCGERVTGLGPLTPLQRPPGGEHPAAPGTVELLQAVAVVLGQAVLGGVAHWALVKGPHDGVGR